MTCLIPDNRVNPRYLYYVGLRLAKYIERDAQGIGVRGVTQKYVSELQIPLPPLTVQQEIVDEIEGYQAEIIHAQQEIESNKQKISNKISEVWGE